MAIASLIKISPLAIASGTRIDAYASSMDDASVLGLNGILWEPAIITAPTLTMTLWDGDFTSPVQAGSASFSLKMNVLTKTYAVDGCMWVGAPVEIYAEAPGTAWPWTLRFKGKVSSFTRRDQMLSVTAEVDNEPFSANVLTATYAGTGGAEGSSNLKDRVKPLVLGYASNVEPILVDETNSVYQFSGYGAIEGIPTLYERGSDFGASVGDYASYAALVAATIPAGRWATCLAAGMVRLGAPAAGVITGDVRGHKIGASTPRLTGAVTSALATIAGVSSSLLDSASLTAIDTAVPYNINLVLTDQVSFIDIATELARCCNWQAGVSLVGTYFVSKIDFTGSELLTLNPLGTTLPQVTRSDELDTSIPYYRIVMGAARSWRVHTGDEIAYYYTVEEKGLYNSATTYKGGQVVSLADQSRWIYTNNTPSAGNAPPTWPTTFNLYWSNLSGPAVASALTYADGTTIEALKPAQVAADKTSTNTAAAITGQGALATANTVNLASTGSGGVSGQLPVANAAAGLVNTNVTLSSAGVLAGAGGGSITLGGLSTIGAFGSHNMLQNGDFLLSSSGIPTGFGVYNNAAISVTTTVNAGGPIQGSNYFRIQANAATASTFGFRFTPAPGSAGSVIGAWQPNTNYIVSFYARIAAGTSGQTAVIGANNPPATQTWLQNPPIGANFQRYAFLFNFGSNTIDLTGYPFVSFGNGSIASGTQLDIACVQIQQGDALSGWAPAPSTSNLTYGPGGVTLVSLKPAQANADVTGSNVAAGITGQGALATKSTVTYGTSDVSGFGALAARVKVSLGDGFVFRADGTTSLTDALAVTSLGTAAAISGQGALATKSTISAVDVNTGAITTDKLASATGNLIANSDFASGDFTNWRPWSTPASCTVVLNSDVDVPTGAPSKYVAKMKYSGAAATVSIFTGSKAFSDTGADRDGFEVIPGEIYRVRLDAVRSADFAATNFQVLAFFQKSDGTYNNSVSIITLAPASVPTTWSTLTGTFTVPAGMQRCWMYVYIPGMTAGLVCFTRLFTDRVRSFVDLTSTAVRLGTNIVRADGTTSLTDALAVTSLGTAAAIAGQGALATKSTVTYGTGDVTGFGAMAARAKVSLGDGFVFRADGTTSLTDALAVTSLGTAAAISGQGALATKSTVTYGTGDVTGFGAMAARASVLLGDGFIFRADGITSLTDALAVTSLGTAAAITGQAATATSSDYSVITGTKPPSNATNGAPTGTPVGSITASDVSTTIQSGGGVASNQVTTVSVVSGAITGTSSAYTAGAVSCADNAETSVQTLTVTTSGGVLQILCTAQLQSTLSNYSGQLRVYRGTTLIWSATNFVNSATGFSPVITAQLLDAVSAGTYTYKIALYVSGTGVGAQAVNRTITTTEFKR